MKVDSMMDGWHWMLLVEFKVGLGNVDASFGEGACPLSCQAAAAAVFESVCDNSSQEITRGVVRAWSTHTSESVDGVLIPNGLEVEDVAVGS